MVRSCVGYVLVSVLGGLALRMPAFGESAEYEHFVGEYAYEATGLWGEFEIVRVGDGFAAQTPDGSKFADFKAVDGSLISKGEDGEDIWIRHDRAKGTYALSGTTQVSTFRGTQNVRFIWAMRKVMPMPGKALEEQFGVTAVSLVRRVRQSEQWMHEFSSLRFVAEVTWTHTPAGIEYRKQQIKAEDPDADLSRERFYGFAPVQEGREEFCVDRRRFRVSESYPQKSEQVRIWDGQTYMAYTKHHTHDQEEYYIDPDLGDHGKILMAGLAWPRSQRHEFWWHGDVQDETSADDSFGRAEDFVLTGKQDYHSVPCYVLECRPGESGRIRRWYVGLEDGLLRGNHIYEEGHLSQEYWTDRYQQVGPGRWFPTIQGYHLFEDSAMLGATDAERSKRDTGSTHFIAARRDIQIGSIEVNQPLAEERFRMGFQEDVKVIDLRFGGIVTYRYKKGMTEQEWEEIRREALRRMEEDFAAKRALDARMGKEAPAFPASCTWLNSAPLTWQDLRGKAVVLQFWGRTCGPCHNYVRLLKAAEGGAKVIVIGIHVPDDDPDAVKEIMARYGADGPVCVDASPDRPGQGFGLFSGWFAVKAIPSWFAVGPDGRIAGHSMQPHEAFHTASKALSANK